MARRAQHQRTSVAGAVPDAADILVGEIVVNMADRTLRTKNGSNATIRLNQNFFVGSAPDDPVNGDAYLDTAGKLWVYANFGFGLGWNEVAPAENLSSYLQKAGGTMTGQITLLGGGSGSQAISVTEATALDTASLALALLKTGGTMSGHILLPAGASGAQAVRYDEMAAAIAAAVPPDLSNVLLKVGGTMTGQITLPGGGTGNQAVSANELAAAVAAHAAQPDPHTVYTLTTELDAYISSNNVAVALKAPLASPVFTGNPTAPTASPGDNDLSLANTAFVTAALVALAPSIAVTVVRRQVFTASGTYTPHASMLYCTVTATGSGGGGGGANASTSSDNSCGGGGGGGGTTRETYSAATIGASQTVTIGAAGTAGASSGTSGGAGGNTTFGALMTAGGGVGGTGQSSSSAFAAAGGGTGGTATGGETNIPGGAGAAGIAATAVAIGGNGGGTFWGTGGRGGARSGAHSTSSAAGTAYGAGGGGGAVQLSTSGNGGGVGMTGIVEVIEYCSA